MTEALKKVRQENDADFKEAGGVAQIDSMTPEEVLDQVRKMFHPWNLEMAAPLSWFVAFNSPVLLGTDD